MPSHTAACLFFLIALTACGARTDVASDAPTTTHPVVHKLGVVTSLLTEGERIYYVANAGHVLATDAVTGATTELCAIPIQPLNVPVALALDADWFYFTSTTPVTGGWRGLFRVPKAGGTPEPIASGEVDNVLVDETGLYWTTRFRLEAKHEISRRRPDGTTLLLGVIDDSYDTLQGIFHGTAGLLISSRASLLAFDIEGAGATVLSDVVGISFPFERDGALFYNVDYQSQGLYRASLDGTMPQRLYEGYFQRVITDGTRWVFASPTEMEADIFAAPYPDGELSFVYHSPTYTSERAVALTPTHLVLGTAWWEFDVGGIQILRRDELGL